MNFNYFAAVTAVTLSALGSTSVTQAMFLGPTPYQSFSDSPFRGAAFSYFHLEDFEDGGLNTPGVTVSAGIVLHPASLTDSVDGDDGAIDGLGTGGHSWFTAGSISNITFTFSGAALGRLPTHAGIVWTDVGFSALGIGVDPFTFEAFDATNASLGVIGPFDLGDGSAAGGTDEDRFFGVTHVGGLSSIRITAGTSVDWEVDHLQYGAQTASSVPEPATWLLVGTSILGLRLRRRTIAKAEDRPASVALLE